MTSNDIKSDKVQNLIDRQEIMDCILRFNRGIDRADRNLILSAYHPDATCDHGVKAGDVTEYVDFSLGFHRERQISHSLMTTNHLCEVIGEVAHTETYFFMVQNNREAPLTTLIGGRYLDRFERRAGVWAIAFRRCLLEWRGTLGDIVVPPEVSTLLARAGVAARDTSDPSYIR